MDASKSAIFNAKNRKSSEIKAKISKKLKTLEKSWNLV
jgi:hypothetical protein